MAIKWVCMGCDLKIEIESINLRIASYLGTKMVPIQGSFSYSWVTDSHERFLG